MTDAPAALLITRDEHLLDDALRVLAAADVIPYVCADVTEARGRWTHASSVIVCEDFAEAMARTDPPRRDDVFLVHRGGDPGLWRQAVRLGASHVFSLEADEEQLVEAIARAREGRGEACLIGVMGGCGGAGASTLAAALAMSGARRGLTTLLIDGDPLGGGIDLIVGIEHAAGARWPEFTRTHGRINGAALREVLPVVDGLATLSWDRGEPCEISAETMGSIVGAGVSSHDLVVVDLPRVFGPVADQVLRSATTTLMVVPEDIRSIGAAQRSRDHLLWRTRDVALVARRRSGGMDAALVSDALALPVIARLRDDKRMAGSVDAGEGPLVGRSLRRGCRGILDALGLVAA
ncbi:septum site determining protein [soil metagenome]